MHRYAGKLFSCESLWGPSLPLIQRKKLQVPRNRALARSPFLGKMSPDLVGKRVPTTGKTSIDDP